MSHGPHCLDGVAAAVAIARYHSGTDVRPHFSGNPKINEVIRGLKIDDPLDDQELWITDISWTSPETDAFLRRLANRGLKIFWIDHHRTAIERVKDGTIDVPFAHQIVDDRFAASRLGVRLPERTAARAKGEGTPLSSASRTSCAWLTTTTAGCTRFPAPGSSRSRCGHERPRSVRGPADDRRAAPPTRRGWRRRYERVAAEMKRSFEIAERSRTFAALSSGVQVVAAVCDGYPSEIADRWGRQTANAVFVLFDLKSGAISYRRSPDCAIDLSAVAAAFGGGGHPAAAGCEIPELLTLLSRAAGERVAEVVKRLGAKS